MFPGNPRAPWLRHGGGLVAIATISVTIILVVCEPSPGLDKNAYLLAVSGIFLAAVARVFAAVSASSDDLHGHGRRATPSKVKYAAITAFVVATGISAASFLGS